MKNETKKTHWIRYKNKEESMNVEFLIKVND